MHFVCGPFAGPEPANQERRVGPGLPDAFRPRVEVPDDANYHRQTGIEETKYSELASVGLAKGDEQSFGFTWLRTQSAADRATIRTDDTFPFDMPVNGQVNRLQGIQYTERSSDSKQLTWQRKWDWIDVDAFGSHNLVRQYDPDTRRFKEEVSHPDTNTWDFFIT